MFRKPKGIKKQVFGSMLCVLGITVIIFDLMTAGGLELFYIALVAAGCSLCIYGSLENRKG